MHRTLVLSAATGLAMTLAACNTPPLTSADRPILVAKCEDAAKSTIKGITPEQSAEMCGCTADKLIADKMTAMQMFSSAGRDAMKQCAVKASVGAKQPGAASTVVAE